VLKASGSRHVLVHRLIATTVLPLVPLATACSTVVAVSSPAQFVATKSPHMVWVTKTDNTVLALQSPQIIADTLGGFVRGDFIEMPLSSVQVMRARQAAPKHTLLLVGGVTLASAVAAAMALHSASAPPSGAMCNDADPEAC